jgi:hypothetical protein
LDLRYSRLCNAPRVYRVEASAGQSNCHPKKSSPLPFDKAQDERLSIANFHMRHPFVVRLSNHERIFSQLPFCRRENSLRYSFDPSLRKRGSEISGPTMQKLFNEFQIRHTSER